MAFASSAHSHTPFAPLKRMLEESEKNKDDKDRDEDENEEKEKKKTVRKRPKMDKEAIANYLVSNDGLPRLYTDFRDIKFKGRGHEKDDLKLLMRRYEEWAFKLIPGLSFPDFIEKVESVGNMHLVFSQLSNYRDIEADKKEAALSGGPAPEAKGPADEPAAPPSAGAAPAPPVAAAPAVAAPAQDDEDDVDDEDLAYAAGMYDEDEEYLEEDEGAQYALDIPGDDDEAIAAAMKPSHPTRAKTPPPPNVDEELLERIAKNKAAAMERLKQKQEEQARLAGGADEPQEDREEEEMEEEESVIEGTESSDELPKAAAAGAPVHQVDTAEQLEKDSDAEASSSAHKEEEAAQEEAQEEAAPVRRTFRKADREALREKQAARVRLEDESVGEAEQGAVQASEGTVDDGHALSLEQDDKDKNEEDAEGKEQGGSEEEGGDGSAGSSVPVEATLAYEEPQGQEETLHLDDTLAYEDVGGQTLEYNEPGVDQDNAEAEDEGLMRAPSPVDDGEDAAADNQRLDLVDDFLL